jgi:hypothetical protein
MPRPTKSAKTKQRRSSGVGDALVESMSEAVVWARGEIDLPAREPPGKKRTARKARPTASALAAGLVFEGPGDLSTNPKYMEGFGESGRRGRKAQNILDRIGGESKCKGTDKLTSRDIDRVIAAARRESGRPNPTVAELAGDLIGCMEGPGDLLTNPKHMAGYGKPNRPIQVAASRMAKKKGARGSASGRLFLSFWHIALENLPLGSFVHRRIAPEEARECIARARKDAALACCSADDLLAPYRKDRRDDHRAMCRVLTKHFGIALKLLDFMTPPDENGSYTTFPLQFAKASGGNRLLVVTCMYMLPNRKKKKSAFPWRDMEIDPESVRFHLFESLGGPGSVQRPIEQRKGP